jgi:hypothetical protein
MALYALVDLLTDDAGEIQFEYGDLKVASVKRSHLQALNWLVMTNRSEMVTEPDAAANVGSFQGFLNNGRTHRSVESSIRRAIIFQGLFDPGDLDVRMTPVSLEDAALTVRMRGQYVESDPEERDDPVNTYQTLAYLWPYENTYPVRLSE